MPKLSVNIDHVATVRQARRGVEPDPIRAAHEAELGGAHGITVHLREDRRHIQDEDVRKLRGFVGTRFNFEMAATDEMVRIARDIRPHSVMIVPEGRDEVTTEGGLDVIGNAGSLAGAIEKLKGDGLLVSAFIDPDEKQIARAAELGFDICEVHTGPYAHAFDAHGGDLENAAIAEQLALVRTAGESIINAGMRFNAGHALNYHNVMPIAALPNAYELHIGHAIVSRAIYVGLREAVRQMVALIGPSNPSNEAG